MGDVKASAEDRKPGGEKSVSETGTNKASANKMGTNKVGTNKAGTNKAGTNKAGEHIRRAIPPGAKESQWTAHDGFSIRRIDFVPSSLPNDAATSDAKSSAATSNAKTGAPTSDAKTGAAASDAKSSAATSNAKTGAPTSDAKTGAAASDAKPPHPPRLRGSILFMPGRGDAYEKYLETLHEWRARGWHVTAADWRGQAGSGRLGGDETTGHIDDFTIWLRDLQDFWQEWRDQTPGPHILVGHSMGGHLAMRAVAEKWAEPDALILSAPMLGFTGDILPYWLMHRAARLMRALGNPARPAWKWSEKPGALPEGRMDLLTHDRDRYDDEIWWRNERPQLVMGPGSWGWVERAYASMRALHRGGVLEGVSIPVLILTAREDRLVSIRQIDKAAARLPKGQVQNFGEEAHHEILREVDRVRDQAMQAVDAFLDLAAPANDAAA